MGEERIEALIEEAVTHCYDAEEAFWAMFCFLQARLCLPLEASVRGKGVTLVGLDEPSSDPQRGMMARVRSGDGEDTVALAELELVDPDPVSADWLAAYRHWLAR